MMEMLVEQVADRTPAPQLEAVMRLSITFARK